MRSLILPRPPLARLQRGVTMLEVLVTLFIITLFLLATAGVQSSAVKLNKAAQFRTDAVLLAAELGERMEANLEEAANGTYACDPCSTSTTSTACVGSTCGSANLAAFDLAEWGARVGAKLPSPTVTVAWTAGTPGSYLITIAWSDRRSNVTYSTTGSTETFQYAMTKSIYYIVPD
jgi:type IV pilus assembly protein PilV